MNPRLAKQKMAVADSVTSIADCIEALEANLPKVFPVSQADEVKTFRMLSKPKFPRLGASTESWFVPIPKNV